SFAVPLVVVLCLMWQRMN
ncbi:hypothetical protein BVZ80_01103B, partial [Haemophilus influenzae]